MRSMTFGIAAALVCSGLLGCSWFGDDDHRDSRESRDHRNTDDAGFSRGGPREDWNRPQYDPVCRMQADPKSAISYFYKGQYYYFDSIDCAKKFRDHPDQYSPLTEPLPPMP